MLDIASLPSSHFVHGLQADVPRLTALNAESKLEGTAHIQVRSQLLPFKDQPGNKQGGDDQSNTYNQSSPC
jgi:hypothetical protein